MPDIDYQFRLLIKPRAKRVQIKGSHDGFPSYSILIDGKRIYDFEQDLFVEAPISLMGNSDIEVDREVSY